MTFTTSPKCILLFDIDGTLITKPTGKPSAGVLAMNEAAFKLTGVDKLANSLQFAGATDIGIAKQLLIAGGIQNPQEEKVEELLVLYTSLLDKYLLDFPYVQLGKPHSTIPMLRTSGYFIGLGTGNVALGAQKKLESAGIAELFNFSYGGYGEDSEARHLLLKAGVERCTKELTLPVIIIGDTPRDISAAHKIGALCVGVPHSQNSQSVLKRAGADAIVSSVCPHLLVVLDSLLAQHY